MVSPKRFRECALALVDASEAPHMERVAFRTPQRIFATLAADGTVNFKLPVEMQELLGSARPAVFSPVPGGWGSMGWTTCRLAVASDADVNDALVAAHAVAQVKAKPRKSSTKK